MESRTTFDITKTVRDWKFKLSTNSSITSDNINELESHLLDEITELQSIGLNEEEAFMVAQKRIGSLDNIAIEFSKINRIQHFSNRILPYLRGVLAYVAILGILNCLLYTLMLVTKTDLNLLQLLDSHPIKFGVFLTIVFSMIGLTYFCFENKIQLLKRLTEIPILIATIVVSRIVQFIMFPQLILVLDHKGFSIIDASSRIFSFYIIIILVVMSLIIHYTIKRRAKLTT